MAGITALGTIYNLPNYTGELINVTPVETPLLSAIGGLNGGGQVTDTQFEWQTKDIRPPAQNVALEGADAPTETARVRANITNVVEIHHSTIGVSYTKLAAVGRLNGLATAGMNPVTSEFTEQVLNELAAMAQDVDYSFLYGKYQLPTDNTTARKTRGLITAITTNVLAKASLSGTGATTATDIITSTAHGLSNGDVVVINDAGTATGIVPWQKYFVVSSATNTFKVAATLGGAGITLGTGAGLAWRKPLTSVLDWDTLMDFLQGVYDNGGMRGATKTLIVGSQQKRAITAAMATAFAKAVPVQGRIGGVVVDQIDTDFGSLNILLHPRAPRDAIVAAALDEMQPVFLETPGKGHMFVEPLAKVGSKDRSQIYGEVGLKYGAEQHHGILTGLKA